MTDKSQQSKARDGDLSTLNLAIHVFNTAKEVSSVTPVKAAFDIVAILLAIIRDTMVDEQDYVELGLSCIDICEALGRGMCEKKLDDLSESVCDAINRLIATVAEIRKEAMDRSERHQATRFSHSRNDKDRIVGWRLELSRILQVFNTELILNTHTVAADILQDVSGLRGHIDNQNQATQNSVLGDPLPPLPRVFFGRDDLINEIVDLTQQLTPIALIGAAGTGKTSIILKALYDERVKRRFGQDRRFIRCDEFPPSCAHFLRRLSSAIGAGIENPEDLSPLRRSLSSKDMLIVLDNAESILDPEGPSAQEIYTTVDELTRFSNICLCITSRISVIPPSCKVINVPTLSTEATQDTFYRIYGLSERSDSINNILEQLDNHPLSIALLATVAQHNQWDANRLIAEWHKQRTGVLRVQHSRSLATAIDPSFTSPMFRKLGPDARSLLEVVAFLPQGISEENTDLLFPTIPDVEIILDKFCILSLAYRKNRFITMLAPLRDHLRPKDPASSPLLNRIKEPYFARLSGEILPGQPGFEEARWIATEDVNVEQLLDVFTTIDTNSESIWDTCAKFMAQLNLHKPRLVTLGPKIEALPDNHPFKPQCLTGLSRLFASVGNSLECKRLLSHSLTLWRERGDDFQVAQTLECLSNANRLLGLSVEAVGQAEEAFEILGRIGSVVQQAECLINLARVLLCDRQLDAAEKAGSRAIGLLPEIGEELWVCRAHRVLGEVYQSKSKTRRAIRHFEVALRIASPLNAVGDLFWVNHALADAFSAERKFGDAQTHMERAKLLAVNNTYFLARASLSQAQLWRARGMLGEAKSEALYALEMFEKLENMDGSESIRRLLRGIEGRGAWRYKWRLSRFTDGDPLAKGFTDEGTITQESSTKLRGAESAKEKPKEQKAEGARHRGQGQEAEVVPSTTKKAPEKVSKPPEKTTVRTATREATQDGVPQPSERITTEAFEGEGSTPENTTADPVRETQKFIDAMDEESAFRNHSGSDRERLKLFNKLCKTCSKQRLLPTSMRLQDHKWESVDPDSDCYGGFATVFRCTYKGREVAVKLPHVTISDFDDILGKFCREAVAWRYLNHANILPLLGVALAEGRLAMVSEWMKNGNINDFIGKNPNANRTELLVDVANGLKYMHGLEMIHGDLKGANILINQDRRACLADFGFSTITGVQTRAATGSRVSVLSNDSVMSFTHGGSIRWMSPELILPQQFGVEGNRPTKMSDCYAFGMVIYEVLCGHAPYHNISGGIMEIMAAILDGVRPEKPENAMDLGFTEALWETVERCWVEDRSARPDVKDILSCLSGTPLARRAGMLTAFASGSVYKRILGAF